MESGTGSQSPTQRLLQKYRSGSMCLTTFVHVPSPALVELSCYLGSDLVVIDTEHGATDLETVEHMVRAADAANTPALVRLPYPDVQLINRALDTGASGVLLPHLDSVELAEAAVRAAKFGPIGLRSAGGITRAGRYSLWNKDEAYANWANANTMVFGLLEENYVRESLPEILNIDGLDGFVLGHADLADSLSVSGEIYHPLVEEALASMSEAILNSNKILCRVVRGGRGEAGALDDLESFRAMGVKMVGVSATSFLIWGANAMVSKLQESGPDKGGKKT